MLTHYWRESPLRWPTLLLAAGTIAALIGFCTWLFGSFSVGWKAGLTGSVPVLLPLLYRDGVQLDRYHGRYRQFWTFAGLRFGSWELLPTAALTRVVVKHFSEVALSTDDNTGAVEGTRNACLVVLLSVEHRRQGLVIGSFARKDSLSAEDFANELGAYLNLPVVLPLDQLV